jgi:hypothetical protein
MKIWPLYIKHMLDNNNQELFGAMKRLEHVGIAGHLHACDLFHVVAAVAWMAFGDRKTWATDDRQQD